MLCSSSKWQSCGELELAFPYIDVMLEKAQDPSECDKFAKIQKILDDTKIVLVQSPLVISICNYLYVLQFCGAVCLLCIIMCTSQHESLEKALDREHKLGDMVRKSEDLNAMSKKFFENSKSMNSCCILQ